MQLLCQVLSYLPLACGNWVYCCAFQDVCTKQAVGWQVRADMPEARVTTALQRALLAQRPAPGLIVHSDRGGQYVSNVYKTLLRDAKAQRSHSRRGQCYDNAQAERLWARLKTDLLELRDWPVFLDLANVQASVAEYFDYYNHKRRHSSIGYLKPQLFTTNNLLLSLNSLLLNQTTSFYLRGQVLVGSENAGVAENMLYGSVSMGHKVNLQKLSEPTS